MDALPSASFSIPAGDILALRYNVLIMIEKTKYIFAKQMSEKQIFTFYLLLAFLFVYPILSANVYYFDDFIRKVSGYYGWGYYGRPLADYFMNFITFSSTRLGNIGQLTQLAVIPCLAFAAYFAIKHLYKKPTLFHLIIWSTIILNPYLLANISYRYDCLFMIIAYTLGIVAAFIDIIDKKTFCYSFALLTVSLFLYQPMASIFIGVTTLRLCHSMINRKDQKNTSIRFLLSMASYILSNLLYFLIIKIAKTMSYMNIDEKGSLMNLDWNLFGKIANNYIGSIGYIAKYFDSSALWVYLILLVLSLAGFIVTIYNSLRLQTPELYIRYKIFNNVMLILSPILIFIGLFGPLVLLINPIIQWRTIAGLGCVTIWMILFSYALFKKLKYKQIIIIPTILVLFSIISFSFVHGTYLKSNQDYVQFVISQLSGSLSANNLSNYEITTIERIGKPYSSWLIIKNQPSIAQSIPELKPKFQVPMLAELGIKARTGTIREIQIIKSDICNKKTKPIITTPWYKIYPNKAKNNKLVVVFINKKVDNICSQTE